MDEAACPGRHEGSVVLITGSTHGIGRGMARRFAREGAAVVVNDHGEYDGEAVAAELREAADTDAVGYVEADVGDPDALRGLVESTVEQFGGLDVLVNNVGLARTAHPRRLSVEDWERVMDTSLRSGWLATKYAVEQLAGGGSVVNVSSAHGHATTKGYFPYNVAKAGVDGLTRALAVELGDIGVRVNAVSPGPIVIDEQQPGPDRLDQGTEGDPLGRMGTVDDVAGLAAYLASDDAAYLTGTVVRADGGRGAVQYVPPGGR